nr:reverse transcriptase domain-containing protein [Tanacetum cinerariifolium]
MIVAGADNSPSMLEKSLSNCWQNCMLLYIKENEHNRMMLNSVLHEPLFMVLLKWMVSLDLRLMINSWMQKSFKMIVISSSKLSRYQTFNQTSSTNTSPKGHAHRSSKQKVENSNFEEHLPPVATMANNRTMAEMLRAPTEGCAEAIVISTAMLKQLQATPTPASVKAVEEMCLTCRAAGNYNQGNPGYRPQGVANQMRPPGFVQPNIDNNQNQFGPPQGFNHGNNFNQEQSYQATAPPNQNFHLNELEKIKRMNDVSMKAMHQIDMVKNELRNEMKTSIQTSLSNQTNEIKNMMASLLQMNIASTSGSGSLPSNTVSNPKGELKAITTCSGLDTDGPTVPTPPKSITPEVGECVEETYTDPYLVEYTIKVLPPPVQKYKPPSQRDFVVHKRDSPPLNIPYPSRMLKQKQQEKDEVQIQKFWQMFKQLHFNITLAEALVLMPKYQKMLKDIISNKEKLQELANTPLNENYSAIILKKLPEKLRDPGKFFIPFTFPADFVVVDYESDPRVPLILGRPFLRTARALIDVHGEEMILHDDDERLTLNIKHDTTSYSNHPQRESVNFINIFNVSSEDFLKVSVSKQPSGNPTFSLHQKLTSPEVTCDIHDSEGCNVLSEKLPDINSSNDIHPHFDDNPLSGSTTYSSNSLLEEFTNELALITYPPDYDDNLQFDIESDLKEIEFLLYQGKDSSLKNSID